MHINDGLVRLACVYGAGRWPCACATFAGLFYFGGNGLSARENLRSQRFDSFKGFKRFKGIRGLLRIEDYRTK